MRQQKTGQSVRFELNEQTRQAIEDYLRTVNKKPGEFLFSARTVSGRCMLTRQYARRVARWVTIIGLDLHIAHLLTLAGNDCPVALKLDRMNWRVGLKLALTEK